MVMSLVLVYIIKVIPWLISNIFLRFGTKESYQSSSESEAGLGNEISFLSDFSEDPVSLEAEGFNNIIKEITT